ncbi:MAG: ATPase domain-containing protein [Methanomassiliicoccales archaeon]|jgi:circadian clock protein KaiC|nr:ATPase domain-containing protein [Methanomassiliicoccales archaeon]
MQGIRQDSRRCVTGIEDLDKILNGGIPVGNMVVVAGSYGTGKTTLAFEFLVRGALVGEKGLLVLTAEPPEKMLSNILRFDFFEEKMIVDGRIQIVQLEDLEKVVGGALEIDMYEKGLRLLESIGEIVEKSNIKRMVIDSFSSLFNDDPLIRGKVLRKLSSLLYEKECTAMVVLEGMDGREGAIADGIILLSNYERRGDLLRIMQVIKMKGTDHSRSKYVVDFTTCGMLASPLLRGGAV